MWNTKDIYLNKVVRTTHSLRRVGLRCENLVLLPRFVLYGGLYLSPDKENYNKTKHGKVRYICMCQLNKVNEKRCALTLSQSFWTFSLAALASEHPPHIIGGIFAASWTESITIAAKTTPQRRCALGVRKLYIYTPWVTWHSVLEDTINVRGVCFNWVINHLEYLEYNGKSNRIEDTFILKLTTLSNKKLNFLANTCFYQKWSDPSQYAGFGACDPWLEITGIKLSHRR